MTFTLDDLPFAYDALAPHMSAETLEFHHDKHHQAYISKANELITGTGLEALSLEEAMLKAAQNADQKVLFNQLGQHYNHDFFWKSLTPNGGGTAMSGNLESAINDAFGSYDEFRAKFIQGGVGQFGSGWVWLVMDNGTGKLEIMSTGNADTPLAHGKTPLLTCDVWEHAYYIDYRNARPKFLEAVIDEMANWEFAAANFENGPLKIAA